MYCFEVYEAVRGGVSDQHCMSGLYLAEEAERENREKIGDQTTLSAMIKLIRRQE